MKKLGALVLGLSSLTASADEIDDLASPNYQTRAKAHAILYKNRNEPETQQKLIEALKSPDAEVARRAELILREYLIKEREKYARVLVQQVKEECEGKLPWLDMLDNYQITGYYMQNASGVNGPPEWGKYRNATELYLYDEALAGANIRKIVEKMKEAELRWIDQNPQFKIPPTWSR